MKRFGIGLGGVAAALLLVVILRGSVLEWSDLSDPTETRYAVIAHEMTRSGDWLTPRLPLSQESVPYLGKPPLHFWLTAAAFSLLGVDEWTARLPGYLAAVGVLLLLIAFGARCFSLRTGFFAALIAATSGEFFVFAGASTVDMTLTFFLTLAMFTLACAASSQQRRVWAALLGVAVAGGFLTKGPLAIVLVGAFTAALYLGARGESPLRDFPCWLTVLVAAFLALPWFALAELRTPGFLGYFFWNENIARYLVHGYGDRYGSGHTHPYGASWLFLFLGFLPWSPLLLVWVFRDRASRFQFRFWELPAVFRLILAAAVAPPLFFTCARQLTIGYLLPSIPALALLLAHGLDSRIPARPLIFASPLFFSLAWLTVPLVIIVGMVCGARPSTALLALGILLAGMLAMRAYPSARSINAWRGYFLGRAGLTAASIYAVALLMATPYVNFHRSCSEVLRQMVENIPQDNPRIGVFTRNTYSHYWLTGAWASELGRPATIVLVSADETWPTHLLVERKEVRKLHAALEEHSYSKRYESGTWAWFEASGPFAKKTPNALQIAVHEHLEDQQAPTKTLSASAEHT